MPAINKEFKFTNIFISSEAWTALFVLGSWRILRPYLAAPKHSAEIASATGSRLEIAAHFAFAPSEERRPIIFTPKARTSITEG